MADYKDLAVRFTVESSPSNDEVTRALWLDQWYTRALVQINMLPGIDAIAPRNAFAEMAAMRKDLTKRADGVLGFLGYASVPVSLAVQTSFDVLRDILVAAFIAAADGAPAHWGHANVVAAQAKLGPEQFGLDYQARLTLFQAVAKIGESGILQKYIITSPELQSGTVHQVDAAVAHSIALMKSQGGASGLGEVPVIPVGILVAAVALILGLATIVALYEYAATNNRRLHEDIRLCQQMPNPTQDQKDLCNKLAEGANVDWYKTAMYIGGIGVGVFLLIEFLPQVTERFMSAKKTAATA